MINRPTLVWAFPLLVACSGASEHAVMLVFEPRELGQRVDHIELSLVESCDALGAYGPQAAKAASRADLARGMEMPGLGAVEDGTYGLYARAIGPCVAAAGCVPITIEAGNERTFEVTLNEIPASMYDAERQDNGGCGDAICTEESGEAACSCPTGFTLEGTTCLPEDVLPPPPVLPETYLSDWAWLLDRNGWGPVERDRSNNDWPHRDGNVIRIDGRTYEKGLGVNAPSEVRVNLDGRCRRFRTIVGLDDEVSGGNAEIEVLVDGRRAHYIAEMMHDTPAEQIDVDVEGAYDLRLNARHNGDYRNDHVDWAEARVECEEGWRGDAIFSPVSEWTWAGESNGLGPAERNQSNGGSASGDGTMIEIDGHAHQSGVGVHGASTIELDLAGHCRRFFSDIGIDDEVATGGSVVFQVFGDDELLYESETMTSASSAEQVNVDLVGRSTMRLVVTDAGDGDDGDHADWASARLLCATGWQGAPVDTYVSDWSFMRAENGWGPPERDMSNGTILARDGVPMQIDGVAYAKGIGTNAPSIVELNLDGGCTRFRAHVGVDDSAMPMANQGDVSFRVLVDGAMIFDSGMKIAGEPATEVDVNVTGRSLLRLEVDALADDAWWDFGDWADARVSCEIGAIGIP